MKQLLHDNPLFNACCLCLAVWAQSPTTDTNLHHIHRMILQQQRFTAISLWVAHSQSPLFDVNYFHIAEVG